MPKETISRTCLGAPCSRRCTSGCRSRGLYTCCPQVLHQCSTSSSWAPSDLYSWHLVTHGCSARLMLAGPISSFLVISDPAAAKHVLRATDNPRTPIYGKGLVAEVSTTSALERLSLMFQDYACHGQAFVTVSCVASHASLRCAWFSHCPPAFVRHPLATASSADDAVLAACGTLTCGTLASGMLI